MRPREADLDRRNGAFQLSQVDFFRPLGFSHREPIATFYIMPVPRQVLTHCRLLSPSLRVCRLPSIERGHRLWYVLAALMRTPPGATVWRVGLFWADVCANVPPGEVYLLVPDARSLLGAFTALILTALLSP